MDDGFLDITRTRSSGADNTEIRKVPAESLDFDDETFNAVTCFSVLSYIDQRAAIAEMARILTPNGGSVLGTVGFGYYTNHMAEGVRHDEPGVGMGSIRYLLQGAERWVATGLRRRR